MGREIGKGKLDWRGPVRKSGECNITISGMCNDGTTFPGNILIKREAPKREW